MKIRYQFRCYPTINQKRLLAKEFGCARYAYNYILRLRSDSYKAGKTIGYAASSILWTKHRNDPAFAFLKESSSVPQQQSVRHLQTAFDKFFSKRNKYPKFKSKHGRQSASYVGKSFKLDAANKNLRIAKIGRLKIKWSRDFKSYPSTVTITKDQAGRYFVSLCLNEAAPASLPASHAEVGIDLGINRLATLSNGERIANPRHTRTNAAKLVKLQRRLSRKIKDSKRWKRQRLKIAKHHAHIADSRKDALNKLTTDLVRRFGVIAIEDLNVRGMIKNHCLAKSVSDAGFGMFRQMLTYKCEWYSRELRIADKFFPSSKRCSACGFVNRAIVQGIKNWHCPECSTEHDRDDNAAKNILKFAGGQPVLAKAKNGRGGIVRPIRASARKGKSR